jgi:hypothetical protein
MTTAKWTINTGDESSRIHTIVMQDLMERGVCQCGGEDALTYKLYKRPRVWGIFSVLVLKLTPFIWKVPSIWTPNHSNFIRCLGRDQSTPRFFLFVFKSMEDLFVSWRTSLRSTCRLSTFPIKKNLLYFMLLWRPTLIGLLNFGAYAKGLSPSRLQPSNKGRPLGVGRALYIRVIFKVLPNPVFFWYPFHFVILLCCYS